jgi:hypothetical protein
VPDSVDDDHAVFAAPARFRRHSNSPSSANRTSPCSATVRSDWSWCR